MAQTKDQKVAVAQLRQWAEGVGMKVLHARIIRRGCVRLYLWQHYRPASKPYLVCNVVEWSRRSTSFVYVFNGEDEGKGGEQVVLELPAALRTALVACGL